MTRKKWAESAKQFKRLVALKEDYALLGPFLRGALFESGDRKGAKEACDKGLPWAHKQCHEIPLEEIESVLRDLKSEF